jgi:hypothetical protein
VARTTIQFEDDALEAVKAYAARHRLSLGEAVSELVRKGIERPMVTEERNGLRVLRLGERSPKVTAAAVARLTEEWP